MRINLIKQKTVRNYVRDNARSKVSFEEWLAKIKVADWNIPEDIKKTFNSADLLGQNSHRVIFDIAGNNYRLICKYAFGDNEVHLFVCWIGTHAEYSRLCSNNQQYEINLY
jgi:mRNA interferase HigB